KELDGADRVRSPLGLELVLLESAEALDFRCPAAKPKHGRQVVQDFIEADSAGEHTELDGAGVAAAIAAKAFLEINHPASAGDGRSLFVSHAARGNDRAHMLCHVRRQRMAVAVQVTASARLRVEAARMPLRDVSELAHKLAHL